MTDHTDDDFLDTFADLEHESGIERIHGSIQETGVEGRGKEKFCGEQTREASLPDAETRCTGSALSPPSPAAGIVLPG